MLTLSVAGAAILLRLLLYFQNRSLFLDTLNLGRNYAEKSYAELLGALNYNQHAPPFFSWTTKFLTDIFGMHEYALRLFPLLTGIAAVGLFYTFARRFLNDFALLFVVFLCGFSRYLTEYAVIAKQYSSDAFFSCLLLFFAVQCAPFTDNRQTRHGPAWAVGGGMSIWFSMPAVFVLAGVGLYFLYGEYERRKKIEMQNFLPYFGLFAAWLLSFGLLWYVNLRHSIGSEHLQDYHNRFFLSLTDAEQTFAVLTGIADSIFGKTAVGIAFGFLTIGCGVYHLFKRNKSLLLLLTVPVLTCFAAAVLQKYSMIIRLTLFFFPLLTLLSGFGLVFIAEKVKGIKSHIWRTGLTVLWTAAAVFSLGGRSALPYFLHPFTQEEGRDVLEKLAEENTANQTIFVTEGGRAAFAFYTEHYMRPVKVKAKQVIFQQDYTNFIAEAEAVQDSVFWVFDSHTFGVAAKEQAGYWQNRGEKNYVIAAKAAQAFMWQRKGKR